MDKIRLSSSYAISTRISSNNSQTPSTWMSSSGCKAGTRLFKGNPTVLVGNTLGNNQQAKSHSADNNELRFKGEPYNLPKKYVWQKIITHYQTNQTKPNQTKPNQTKPNQPTIPFLIVTCTEFELGSNTAPQRPGAATSPSPAQAVAQQVLLACWAPNLHHDPVPAIEVISSSSLE